MIPPESSPLSNFRGALSLMTGSADKGSQGYKRPAVLLMPSAGLHCCYLPTPRLGTLAPKRQPLGSKPMLGSSALRLLGGVNVPCSSLPALPCCWALEPCCCCGPIAAVPGTRRPSAAICRKRTSQARAASAAGGRRPGDRTQRSRRAPGLAAGPMRHQPAAPGAAAAVRAAGGNGTANGPAPRLRAVGGKALSAGLGRGRSA
jgi:hypothetical protein